jgi:sulfate adenylyltransferase
MIRPHGGKLVNLLVEDEKEKEKLRKEAGTLPRVLLNSREMADLEMLSTGAMSPLEGFMTGEDYMSVLDRKRLPSGLPWSIPVTLSLKEDPAGRVGEGSEVALADAEENLYAIMTVEEKYKVDREKEAEKVLLTTDPAHPGVQYLKFVTDTYLGGKIRAFDWPRHKDFNRHRLDPKETRVLFKTKGWNTIAAFQTRNPIHRAHEYIQKCTLEIVDALLIHPLMGETKSDDIQAEVRMQCYEALLKNYYPNQRVVLSIFPAAMRYAGPREAIFHAIVRKNYGCTHFIVGRDHAGVGNYYGTYDAHYIFREYEKEEIDITPLFFDHAFFCRKCEAMATTKTCPHTKTDHVTFSGTMVREMLARGEVPPSEFTRKEVAEILIQNTRKEKK